MPTIRDGVKFGMFSLSNVTSLATNLGAGSHPVSGSLFRHRRCPTIYTKLGELPKRYILFFGSHGPEDVGKVEIAVGNRRYVHTPTTQGEVRGLLNLRNGRLCSLDRLVLPQYLYRLSIGNASMVWPLPVMVVARNIEL